MRTLEQFQKEVLAPLRKERDDKQDAAREIRSKAAADYMEAKKVISEKEHAFAQEQEEAQQSFIRQQIIDRACDKLQYEDTVMFESDEDRSNVRLYLDELGYETWCGVDGECKLTISWRHEKSNKK